MNRCDIGSDGETPAATDCMAEGTTHQSWKFGEKILYMPAKPTRGGKWELRFHPGVFVGMLNSSSEAVVVTEARAGDQDTLGEHQEHPRVGEMGRRPNTRNTSSSVVSGWL